MHQLGNARLLRKHDIAQFSIPQRQHIGHCPGELRHAGHENRRHIVPQAALGHPPLLAQLRHGNREPGRGLLHQAAVRLPAVIIGNAALLVRLQNDQFPPLVPVHILNGIADIVCPQQHLRAVVSQGIDLQHLQFRGSLPAHGDLLLPIAVQVLVIDAVNGGAAALDQVDLLIGIAPGSENIDLHGFFITGVPEKRQCFLPAVSVQVHQLDGLDVGAGSGRGILRAAIQDLIDPTVQFRVFGWQGRQTVEVLRAE